MAASVTGYKPAARVMHWIAALMVLAMLPIGMTMTQEGLARSTQDTLFILHKNGGVILLLLMLVRLAYRLLNPPPPLPPSIQPWQARIAELTHILLYLMVFFMALTGFVRVQAGGFPIEMLNALGLPPIVPRNEVVAETAKMAHGYGRFILALLVLAHIGAALLHGLIKKDGVFSRMWPVLGRN